MRFEELILYAFGPFANKRMRIAPGMTVVFGKNEAGKSTMHAGLYAALCGVRRGRGAARREDQEFAAQHKPWREGKSWEVGALLSLDDGRRIELRQNLDGGAGSRAVNQAGQDVSSEIMNEGNPDASRWVGLDRRSFRATACVRQAEVLEVLDDAELLQSHLQRAAAGAGKDQTAALALTRLADFERDQIGQDRANSTKPLRLAKQRLEIATRAREQMLQERQQLEAVASKAADAAAKAKTLASRVARLEASIADSQFRDLDRRLKRVRGLSDRFKGGPPVSPGQDDDLAGVVVRAVHAWASRPAAPILPEPNSDALTRQLDELPEAPVGDLEPDATVLTAQASFERAKVAIELHSASRPVDRSAPAPGIDEQELRRLADILSGPLPVLEQGQPSNASQPPAAALPRSRPPFAAAGMALIVAGLIASFANMLWLGLASIALGVLALVLWFLGRSAPAPDHTEAASPQSSTTPEADAAFAAAVTAREKAQEQARNIAGSDEPSELRRLADAIALHKHAQEALAQWSNQASALGAAKLTAENGLLKALQARGAEIGPGPQATADAYVRACQERARTAVLAAARPGLLERIAYRRQAELAGSAALEAANQAVALMREASAACRLPTADPDAMHAQLTNWLEGRKRDLADLETANRDWADLRALLDGHAIEDLEADCERQRETAKRLGEAVDGTARDEVTPQSADLLAALRAGAADAARQTVALQTEAETIERGLVRPAAVEQEVAAAKKNLGQIEQLAATLVLTRDFLARAQDRVHLTIAPILQNTLNEWLPRVTEGRYAASMVDPQTLKVRIRSLDGHWRDAQLLSHGTAEQTYLLLRLAITNHLTVGRESCPVILDDVVVQSDVERTRAVLELLHEVSRDRQVILFSLSEQAARWAQERLKEPNDRFERLDHTAVPA